MLVCYRVIRIGVKGLQQLFSSHIFFYECVFEYNFPAGDVNLQKPNMIVVVFVVFQPHVCYFGRPRKKSLTDTVRAACIGSL